MIPVVAGSLVDVDLQIVVEVDGEQHESGIFTVQSGGLLPDTPVLSLSESDYTPPDDALLLLTVFGEVVYAVMMDFDGDILWALPQGNTEDNLIGGLDIEPSILSPGELIFNTFDPNDWEANNAEIWRVNLLGEPLERIVTPNAHHFFTQAPDGDILWLRNDIQKVNNVDVVGDIVMRQDLETGESSPFFSVWDTLELPKDMPPAGLFDWTHANWIEYSAARDSYLMSTALANTIVELDPDGEPLRVLNGFGASNNQYVYDDVRDAFAYPHGPHWSLDGEELLVFSTRDHVSNAARYTLSDDDHTLTRSWEYGSDQRREAMLLGEVQELSDGNYLVSWGGLGILQVVTPAGDVLWEVQTPLGSFFPQARLIPDPYSTLQP